jgi:hypothetical protein
MVNISYCNSLGIFTWWLFQVDSNLNLDLVNIKTTSFEKEKLYSSDINLISNFIKFLI